MPSPVDLYDSSYAGYSADVYREIRQETYGLDLGQTSWMVAEALHSFFSLLHLNASSRVLEVGCGVGLAQTVGAEVTGIDVNENGIRDAEESAHSNRLTGRVRFKGSRHF